MESPGDRLRAKRLERGFRSARSAANAHGWTVSTYTSHENGTRKFDAEDADTYARAFRTTGSYLLFGDKEKVSSAFETKGIPVLAEIEVGVWRESDIDTMSQVAEQFIDTPMQADAQRPGRRFAVRVKDTSVNKSLEPGDYAVCVSLPRGRVEASDFEVGQLVLIERTKRGLRELSIRRVASFDNARLHLTAHSKDQRLSGEILYPSATNGERVSILARVVGKYAEFPG